MNILCRELLDAGYEPDLVERIARAMARKRGPRGTATTSSARKSGCLACAQKASKGDYVCGNCSTLKVDRPRQFWGDVLDREAGGEGREIEPREERVDLLRCEYTFNVPEPHPEVNPPRFEWLVLMGIEGIVVVAPYSFEAVRWAKGLLGLPDSASASWTRLGSTDAPASVEKDHNPVCVFEEE